MFDKRASNIEAKFSNWHTQAYFGNHTSLLLVYFEIKSLILDLFALWVQDFAQICKLIFILVKSILENLKTVLEEPIIVINGKDGTTLNMANEIFEKGMDHNINNLGQIQVHSEHEMIWILYLLHKLSIMTNKALTLTIQLPVASHVKVDVFLTTGYEFLSRHFINFVKRISSKFSGRDWAFEVNGNVVHEETLEFPLKPQRRLLGLHIDVQWINILLLC